LPWPRLSEATPVKAYIIVLASSDPGAYMLTVIWILGITIMVAVDES
jgi:hypothetical protein